MVCSRIIQVNHFYSVSEKVFWKQSRAVEIFTAETENNACKSAELFTGAGLKA